MLFAVSHSRQHCTNVWISFKGFFNCPGNVRPWINHTCCFIPLSSYSPGTKRHPSVSEGGAVFNHKNAFTTDLPGIIYKNSRFCEHDVCIGGMLFNVFSDKIHLIGLRTIHLVYDSDICHEHVCFARVIQCFVSGPVGVKNHNVHIRKIEGSIIVSPIPDDNIGFFFSLFENFFVVNSRIDYSALGYQRFIFFSFLNAAVMLFKIVIG